MTALAEAFCAVVAQASDIAGEPGYIRATVIREHLEANPGHLEVWMSLFPNEIQMAARVRASTIEANTQARAA